MNRIDHVLAPVADGRVLVVDDNPANTTVARRILERAGLSDVIELQDPTQVADVLHDSDPDLVLLDLRMPVMDGFQVLEAIQRQAAGNYLPVIVVTADDSHSSVERALEMGAHDFLTKPYNATELVLRVRNLLLNRQAYQELRRSRAWLRTRLDLFEPDLAAINIEPELARRLIQTTIEARDFAIAVQPIVDMRSGALVGGEALARFPNSVLSTPAAWFAAALEVDLVAELELATCRKALELLEERPPGTSLSVNLSPQTVLTRLDQLIAMGIDWTRVVIELTEHTPVEDYPALNRALDPLRSAGARVAVDDTGAGFASLRHILDLRPDVIKIDIAITRGLDQDPSRAAVAAMLVHFAEQLGISVVAEGVETAAERDTLIELGAVLGQGFLLGRPSLVT